MLSPSVFRCFRRTRLLILLAIPLLILAKPASGQKGQTSMGTDFWLGFMPNGAGKGNANVYEDLFIASGTDNKVTITIPGIGDRTIAMSAGQVYDYPLMDYMTWQPDTPVENAIHVTSTNPITVYGYSSWSNSQGIGDSPDGYLALPLESLGTEYYTINFPDNNVFGTMPGEFLIIAPYDNTIVTITPAAETKTGRPAGIPWKDTLQKGQTYLVQSPGTNFGWNDLTGTLITSSKPVGVITGHQITSVPSDCGCYSADNLLEMIPSVDKWGTQYFDMPMSGKLIVGDYLRVLSAQKGNQITYSGPNLPPQTMLLDSGQYQDIPQQTEPMVLTSTNHERFIVAMYAYSQGYAGDPGPSDPFLVLFTPREQFENSMSFRTPTSSRGAFKNDLTIICPDDSISKITINGQPLNVFPSVGKVVFSGTNPLMAAQRIILAARPMQYVAKGPVPFGAYQYGYSDYEGYGWPSGMAQGILSTGDTLPPLMQATSSSCGKYDLRISEPRMKSNGVSFDDTRIAAVSMITAAGDLRWPTPSYNYSFTPDSNFLPGDSVMTATVTVIDPSHNAYAAIWTTDRAGNDTVYQFFYNAPALTPPSGSATDLGTIVAGKDTCISFQWSNQSSGALTLSDATVVGTDPSLFESSSPPFPISLAADSSITQTICFRRTDTLDAFDTLLVTVGCAEFRYPLHAAVVTPLIFASDAVFGAVTVGDTACKTLIVENRGEAPLVIYPDQLLADTEDFSFTGPFPDTIASGGFIRLNICFHPHTAGSLQSQIGWHTNISAPYQNSVKDTSLLMGVGVTSAVNPTIQDRALALSIVPNPASGLAIISIAGAPAANIKIFDVLGRELKSFRVEGSYEWQMGELPPGTYIVRAETNGRVVSKRLLKR